MTLRAKERDMERIKIEQSKVKHCTYLRCIHKLNVRRRNFYYSKFKGKKRRRENDGRKTKQTKKNIDRKIQTKKP